VLLVRNPIEVMASYYKYMTEQGLFAGDIRQFVEHPGLGIAAWIAHTAGWLDGGSAIRTAILQSQRWSGWQESTGLRHSLSMTVFGALRFPMRPGMWSRSGGRMPQIQFRDAIRKWRHFSGDPEISFICRENERA
jgi:hypothetical protein